MPSAASNDRYNILFPELRRGRDETYRRRELMTLTFNVMALAANAVYVLHPHTNFEVLMPYLPFGRYGTFCATTLVGLWPWPLTLKLVQIAARVMGFPPVNFGDTTPIRLCHGVPSCQFWWYYTYSFSIYASLGQRGSDASCDLVTFDLGGHGACGWRGLSSSICISSLKFVGLANQKICVSINRPGDPDLLTFKLVCKSHLRWGTFLQNLGKLGLLVLQLFAMYVTEDRRTGGA